ncbi:MAG: geranylgeranylglycerol-phosphate geranylgeranyltransferase [Chitinispirillaceae bacterium]|nr:geranylgeranylglycerol-phosphate geranylgeranyltransferase [Chitinispirillaceae bacterium]
MRTLIPYVRTARPGNMLMTGAAVCLGFWLSHMTLIPSALALLVIAGMCATAFGNVTNDLRDRATDRISHPDRPLPRGDLVPLHAWLYAAFLALIAVGSALFVSSLHAVATLVPLLLLVLYTRYFKGTPLFGNIVVSLLVAYALLFGGLTGPLFNRLLVPAALAFLLNVIREIIKDLQDEPGDRAAGIATTALLPGPALRAVITVLCLAYAGLLFVPWLSRNFGAVYAIVCAAAALPLHLAWFLLFMRATWRIRLPLLSSLIKIEMVAGLAALALDQIVAV